MVTVLRVNNKIIVDFEHVFVSWAQDEIHKTTQVHIKQ